MSSADSRSPVETDGEITYQTRAVLAEAYPRHQRKFLTHVALVDRADRVVGVLCNRVRADSLADPFADDPASVPTCQTCLKRDPRFVSTPAPRGDLLESIRDVLARAWQFDDKPHLLFNSIRLLAERFEPDAERRAEMVRLMEYAYTHPHAPVPRVSPPRVEGLPEQDFTTGLETPKPMCVGIDMRCAECGNRVEAIREHLTHDGHCLYTAYQRQQSALDALATAVVPIRMTVDRVHAEMGHEPNRGYALPAAETRFLLAAIQQLLQTRETSNG